MNPALFWDVMQRTLVVAYQHFKTAYQSLWDVKDDVGHDSFMEK